MPSRPPAHLCRGPQQVVAMQTRLEEIPVLFGSRIVRPGDSPSFQTSFLQTRVANQTTQQGRRFGSVLPDKRMAVSFETPRDRRLILHFRQGTGTTDDTVTVARI